MEIRGCRAEERRKRTRTTLARDSTLHAQTLIRSKYIEKCTAERYKEGDKKVGLHLQCDAVIPQPLFLLLILLALILPLDHLETPSPTSPPPREIEVGSH